MTFRESWPALQQRRALIEPSHPQLSIARQCALAGVERMTAWLS